MCVTLTCPIVLIIFVAVVLSFSSKPSGSLRFFTRLIEGGEKRERWHEIVLVHNKE